MQNKTQRSAKKAKVGNKEAMREITDGEKVNTQLEDGIPERKQGALTIMNLTVFVNTTL
ncbi:MAG: hypothetical protein MRK02_13415 [Candidatus Scalindua sp.]|nr:hypothetical protein [Candidatus Scalindua sp.]